MYTTCTNDRTTRDTSLHVVTLSLRLTSEAPLWAHVVGHDTSSHAADAGVQRSFPVMKRALLPVVDVGALVARSSAPNVLEAARSLDHAFRSHGFCYVEGHGVDQHLLQQVLRVSREFFDLPLDEKQKISIHAGLGKDGSEAPVRGYQSLRENITLGKADLHEAIDLYSENLPVDFASSPLFGRNKYPSDEFKSVFQNYTTAMLSLGDAMVSGLSRLRHEIKAEMFRNSFWVSRTIRYEPRSPASQNGDLGCGEHTDYGCFVSIWFSVDTLSLSLALSLSPHILAQTNATLTEWIEPWVDVRTR